MYRAALLLTLVMMSTTWTAVASADAKTDKMKKETQIGAAGLGDQVQLYKLFNGSYPKSLKALAEKQPDGHLPLVPPEKLIDPWGRPYEFDPKSPMHKGKYPDVWSKGPNPNDPKGRIGNWR